MKVESEPKIEIDLAECQTPKNLATLHSQDLKKSAPRITKIKKDLEMSYFGPFE
jgi:hypothetical protein